MDSSVGEILDRIKAQFASRGASSIAGLGRAFREMDNMNGNRRLDPQEFAVGLREHGVQVTAADVAALLKFLDTDGDGNINFDEFLVGIRGRMNAHRQETTDRAFAKFDKDGNGFINSDDMQGVYNASQHPKVRNGEMTEA